MGKTQKPLNILLISTGYPDPWVEGLRAKGHKVEYTSMNLGDPIREHTCPLTDEWDLILGPTCARFMPGMEKFLDSFIKGARAVKYKGKKDD